MNLETLRMYLTPLAEGTMWTLALFFCSAVLAVALGLVTAANLAPIMAVLAIVAAAAYFAVILSSRQVSAVERRRVFAFIPLFAASAAFWALFQQ